MMNVIYQNFRGTSNKGFANLIKDLMSEYHSSMIFLLETHLSGPNAKRTIKHIRLEVCFIEEACGQ